MRVIAPKHLAFVADAAKAFNDNPRQETFRDKEEEMIALRYGLDRDCVMVYELGECVGNFVQQISKPQPHPRNAVTAFSLLMEQRLKENDNKGGWEFCAYEYLVYRLKRKIERLSYCRSQSEFQNVCADIGNYAMILYDNDRRSEAKND
ncbi:hypothetical protein E2R60_20465 [Paenibacillus dendritiformis]|uniref:hypothetical protein n=1 Tax=Paenibacillus dendritiformis TaxID=130049 RepID=UPI00105A20C9|nr:hypothetical protein [Paenibacillus dendritiformis]TDL50924.1 hypothetical protein E2R60_20465 [Paenibacillus dendritiformis]